MTVIFYVCQDPQELGSEAVRGRTLRRAALLLDVGRELGARDE
jgi:hypothetical protein